MHGLQVVNGASGCGGIFGGSCGIVGSFGISQILLCSG